MNIFYTLLPLLITGAVVGAAAGFLGSFMIIKRMSLVGDALSHVALPGIAIALAFNSSPILGAFIALTIAVIGIWYLEKTSSIYPEALVGLFFTASLAIGVLITPQLDLLEALFGNIQTLTLYESLFTVVFSLTVIAVTAMVSKKLILAAVSEELARSSKTHIPLINFIYLFLVAAVVALGVKFVGTMLMGALVIIPAASAKNIAHNLSAYYFWSVFFGIASSVIGILLSSILNYSSGPIVVLTGIVFFTISYLVKTYSRT